jgi:hypothetical protein
MRVIKLLLVLLICVVPAAADTVYQVTGSATITGNPVCNGLPCTETIDFSFLVNYLPLPNIPNFYEEHLISIISLASSGPLAPFDRISASGGDYFGFFNSSNDEIDVDGPFGDRQFAPAPFPDLVNSELFGCGQGGASPVCVQDFADDGISTGHVRFGPVQYTVGTVPEGSTRFYLLVGVGLGLFGMLASTQKYCSGLPPG